LAWKISDWREISAKEDVELEGVGITFRQDFTAVVVFLDDMMEWREMQRSQRFQNIFVVSCGGIVYDHDLGLGNSPIFTA
jgi:hypothetical protein